VTSPLKGLLGYEMHVFKVSCSRYEFYRLYIRMELLLESSAAGTVFENRPLPTFINVVDGSSPWYLEIV
jgi:hypothetical protein